MPELKAHLLGCVDYRQTYQAMQKNNAAAQMTDALWLCEHRPIYTLGANGSISERFEYMGINCMRVDRGGSITYHGPGQLIVYPMLTLRNWSLKATSLVDQLEATAICWLKCFEINAYADPQARGIYSEDGAKLGSIGLRIKNQRSYHGLALNLNMDLHPFSAIHPCGKKGMKMTQVSDIIGRDVAADEITALINILAENLMATPLTITTEFKHERHSDGKITWPRQIQACTHSD